MTGVFYVPLGNTGVERTPNKESAHKVDSGEENSPAAPAGIRTRNLSIASPALYLQAIPAPKMSKNRRDNSSTGSYTWNALPPTIRQTESFATFRRRLKAHLLSD